MHSGNNASVPSGTEKVDDDLQAQLRRDTVANGHADRAETAHLANVAALLRMRRRFQGGTDGQRRVFVG
jgi:hypothetical protein